MPIQGTFDATQFTPRQAGDAHPPGKFPASISDTAIAPTKNNDGGMFNVTFTTPAGSIVSRYNLWNQNPKAVEIAQNELSALCHATGVFKLDFQNDGAALRGARCMIDVAHQTDKEGKPTNYVEVKKVYDVNGNEPGKQQQAPAQQPAQTAAPLQQSNNGGWGNTAPAANPAPQAQGAQPAWGTGAAPTGQAAPAANPPWGTR